MTNPSSRREIKSKMVSDSSPRAFEQIAEAVILVARTSAVIALVSARRVVAAEHPQTNVVIVVHSYAIAGQQVVLEAARSD